MIEETTKSRHARGLSSRMQSAVGPDQQLQELARVYALLKQALQTTADLTREAREQATWTVAHETAYEARTAPITDRMHEMAWEAAAIEATTTAGAHAKAQILLDWCEDLKESVKDSLAASLCRDLSRIVGQAQA